MQEYQKAEHGELFYLYDSGVIDPERIIIFHGIKPFNFFHILSIGLRVGLWKHALSMEGVFYLVYLRSHQTFTRFYWEVFNQVHRKPDYILLDFEWRKLITVSHVTR